MKIGRGDANFFAYQACEYVAVILISGVEHGQCYSKTPAYFTDSINLTFRSTPYFGYNFIDTRGARAIARASIYGGSPQGQTVSSGGARWYAQIR